MPTVSAAEIDEGARSSLQSRAVRLAPRCKRCYRPPGSPPESIRAVRVLPAWPVPGPCQCRDVTQAPPLAGGGGAGAAGSAAAASPGTRSGCAATAEAYAQGRAEGKASLPDEAIRKPYSHCAGNYLALASFIRGPVR